MWTGEARSESQIATCRSNFHHLPNPQPMCVYLKRESRVRADSKTYGLAARESRNQKTSKAEIPTVLSGIW